MWEPGSCSVCLWKFKAVSLLTHRWGAIQSCSHRQQWLYGFVTEQPELSWLIQVLHSLHGPPCLWDHHGRALKHYFTSYWGKGLFLSVYWSECFYPILVVCNHPTWRITHGVSLGRQIPPPSGVKVPNALPTPSSTSSGGDQGSLNLQLRSWKTMVLLRI